MAHYKPTCINFTIYLMGKINVIFILTFRTVLLLLRLSIFIKLYINIFQSCLFISRKFPSMEHGKPKQKSKYRIQIAVALSGTYKCRIINQIRKQN